MKLYWTGTDSLMLIDYSMRKWRKKPYWFVFRKLIKILDVFIQEHYCISENIAKNLKKFGTNKPIKIVDTYVYYPDKFEKTTHEGFNVIYYNPKVRTDHEFSRWLYGLDIIEEVKKRVPDVNFIELDGTMDMAEIYPIADFMIRPNRHDGSSRIRLECEINNIPYYWTNGETKPSVNECIKAIYEHH